MRCSLTRAEQEEKYLSDATECTDCRCTKLLLLYTDTRHLVSDHLRLMNTLSLSEHYVYFNQCHQVLTMQSSAVNRVSIIQTVSQSLVFTCIKKHHLSPSSLLMQSQFASLLPFQVSVTLNSRCWWCSKVGRDDTDMF